MGSNMNNFKDVAKSLIRAGAAITVEHADELKCEVLKLAKDASSRFNMQQAGLEWHKLNRGSSQRIAGQILKSL
jgi:3-deoxy-D-manno-octulosonic-acid transferase